MMVPKATITLPALLATVALVIFCTPTAGLSQDEPMEPRRFENVDWHHVVLVNFHPGKRQRALEIIETYFERAAQQSGTQTPILMELQTGPWDMLVIWNMQDGPGDLAWELHPDGVRWMAAMTEIAGGLEEARQIQQEYSSLIARSDSFIGLSGRHGTPFGRP